MSTTNSFPETRLSRRGLLRLFGVASGAALGAGALAACAPSTGGSDEPAGGATDDGVKDFQFTAWSLNEASTKDTLQAMVDDYAAGAGAKITTASYPYNDFLNQVLLQIRGGTLTGAVKSTSRGSPRSPPPASSSTCKRTPAAATPTPRSASPR